MSWLWLLCAFAAGVLVGAVVAAFLVIDGVAKLEETRDRDRWKR